MYRILQGLEQLISQFHKDIANASDYHTFNMSRRWTKLYLTMWCWGKHFAMCRHLSTAHGWSRHSKQQNVCFECLLSDLCSDSLEHFCFDEEELIQGFWSHTGHRRLSSGIICDALSFQRSTPFKSSMMLQLYCEIETDSQIHHMPSSPTVHCYHGCMTWIWIIFILLKSHLHGHRCQLRAVTMWLVGFR